MFPATIYAERRQRLRGQVGSGLILLLGNEESPMNYPDNPFPFRQDSSFLYFFGIDLPGLAGVIDPEEGTEILFGNDVTIDDVIWTGPLPTVREQGEKVGVSRTGDLAELGRVLEQAVGAGRTVHFLPAYRAENVFTLMRLLGRAPDAVRGGASVPLITAVVAQRSVKSAEEIAEIEAAIDVCYDMQTTAMRMARPGVSEQEIVGVMEGRALARGGRTSFPTIFTIRGETLHNYYHGNVMQNGDMAINDSGAESPLRYAGDITRTFPVGGTFTARQREAYEIVLRSLEEATAAVRPGVEFRNVHLLACEVLAAGLKDLGLMKGDVKEAVRLGAHTLFFQCGTGHLLGLDVHDMEPLGEDYVGYTETIKRNPMFGFRSLRLGRAVEPGFAVTVEPGLYFIPQLIDRWRAEGKHADFIDYEAVEAYRDFGGIRIEDDVLVTDEGCRILGTPIPKTVAEVEELASEQGDT
jgi:Xaa-Pro aminopeptidase